MPPCPWENIVRETARQDRARRHLQITVLIQEGVGVSNQSTERKRVVIIGGGPAGLTAALELSNHGVPAVVLEAYSQVGGIARTVNYKGYLFDIGGHRFFTKWDEVNQIWNEVLKQKVLDPPRPSRISS